MWLEISVAMETTVLFKTEKMQPFPHLNVALDKIWLQLAYRSMKYFSWKVKKVRKPQYYMVIESSDLSVHHGVP